MSKKKHLTLDDRFVIEKALDDCKSFKEIGRVLDKDCCTISKEVRNHLVFERKGGFGRAFNDCQFRYDCYETNICGTCDNARRSCKFCGRCFNKCTRYKRELCPALEKPPYVCNGCKTKQKCTLEKRLYRATTAQKEYSHTLKESRTGVNITETELKQLDEIISPLIKNGQSIHHVCSSNAASLMISEKTIYNYIGSGLLSARNLDMPRKVRLKPRKKGGPIMKVDKACRVGRTYDDFNAYCAQHQELPVTELDSVEGTRGGSVLLTIHFVQAKLQLAFLRQSNDSASVTHIFEDLFEKLGVIDYQKILPLLLADNGSEFSDPSAIEFKYKGERISRLFYCDPSAPGQKGHCENNHEFIRRIIPKGVDLGQFTQTDINLAMNHINSYGRPELADKSPYEMFGFLYGENLLQKLGVTQIPRNQIILTPKLLKQKRICSKDKQH